MGLPVDLNHKHPGPEKIHCILMDNTELSKASHTCYSVISNCVEKYCHPVDPVSTFSLLTR